MSKPKPPPQPTIRDHVDPPPTPPEHLVAPGLREAYPDLVDFVDEFLATCLVGDYARYRQYVSRARNPESKERFTAIYYAINSVLVESIEPVDLQNLPSPAYLVTSAVDLKPDQRVAAGGAKRKIAIVVFKEDGEWRMVPAPSSLQPHEGRHTKGASSAPVEEGPEYPWEDSGGG